MDQKLFGKLLFRNIMLPLAVGLISSGIFIVLIFYMLAELRQVDHSDRVIAQTNKVEKLLIDGETGLRGYIITGKENFLDPYNNAIKKLPDELEDLRHLVSENPAQINRVNIVKIRFDRWQAYANEMRDLRQVGKGAKVDAVVTTARGKVMMDDIRDQFNLFLQAEESLRDHSGRARQSNS